MEIINDLIIWCRENKYKFYTGLLIIVSYISFFFFVFSYFEDDFNIEKSELYKLEGLKIDYDPIFIDEDLRTGVYFLFKNAKSTYVLRYSDYKCAKRYDIYKDLKKGDVINIYVEKKKFLRRYKRTFFRNTNIRQIEYKGKKYCDLNASNKDRQQNLYLYMLYSLLFSIFITYIRIKKLFFYLDKENYIKEYKK